MKNKYNSYLLLLIISLMSFTVSAQINYPVVSDRYINDFSNIIEPTDRDAIQVILKRLENENGIEMVVVTIGSVFDYGATTPDIEPFATGLFNDWGIGDKKKNNGVLLLVSKDDRKVRIELGRGYNYYYDHLTQQTIDEEILPLFKISNYSKGIYQGVQGISVAINMPLPWFNKYRNTLIIGALGGLAVVCVLAGVSCMASGKKGWGWVFFTIAIFIIILLFQILRALNKHAGRSGSGGGKGGFGGGSSKGGGASGSW